MISAIIWNCRGIGNPSTVNHLNKLIRKHKVSLVCISEPKLLKEKANDIKLQLGMDQIWVNQYSETKLWTFWRDSISVTHMVDTTQSSSFLIKNEDNIAFYFTGIYASCDKIIRRDLWVDLLNFSSSCDLPWVLGGDLNCVESSSDYVGSGNFDFASSDDFCDFKQFAGVEEMLHEGNCLSWCNNQQGVDRVYKRLDRLLINAEWMEQCNACVEYLPRVHSDHSPMLLKKGQDREGSPSPFRFQLMWTSYPNFIEIVRDKWNYIANPDPLLNLSFKLKGLKQFLRWWNKRVFGDVNAKHNGLLLELSDLESDLQQQWSIECWEKLNQVRRQFLDVEKQQEMFFKQKARINWLSAGDRNTKFFHATLKERRSKNHSSKLLENCQNSREKLKDEGRTFFQKLLCEEGGYQDADIIDTIPELVTVEDNLMLCAIPTEEEIKAAVFSIEADNAPGPDGFSAAFFINCWEVVASDIILAVKAFFKGNKLPRSWKSTFLTLIPKKEETRVFADLRPISLCNVCYKFVAKIIANRLGRLLPKLISPEQGAFVSGRLIHENIAITQELVQYLDRGAEGGTVILNIDMEKAYDRLNWDFLFSILSKFGFSQLWIVLIKGCVTGNSFSVLIDGSSTEFFVATRGLRQGDPISPALFIFTEVTLSRGINNLIHDRKVLLYQVLGRCPLVTHALFADDALLFINERRSSVENTMDFLHRYQKCSG